jgi:predicted O-methyltransferase YrrM
MPSEPTGQDLWSRVDDYLDSALVGSDAALVAALAASADAALPHIAVAPNQGKLLHLLARIGGARRILEVGTLGGYSTIWLARALPPDGHLVTLEIDPRHAAVARSNVDRAGVGALVDIRVGPALETLPTLVDGDPFDLTFIDADKQHNADYFAWALRLSRPGSVIVVDNVVRQGAVADPNTDNEAALGVRRLFELMASEPRVSATAIQTVGVKGHDGLAVAVVG